MPVGAEVVPEGVRFRVWAPRRSRVQVICDDTPPLALAPRRRVLRRHVSRRARRHALRFRLDADDRRLPRPGLALPARGAARPVGGRSTRPRFAWTDAAWPGITLRGQVLYELHVGTFTPEGTWAAAARELPELARRSASPCIEVMPVAEFPGRFGWGYDGVDLFAPDARSTARPTTSAASSTRRTRSGSA